MTGLRSLALVAAFTTGSLVPSMSGVAAEPPLPVAGYASFSLRGTPAAGTKDLDLVRLRDGARRVFSFAQDGRRDVVGITAFLSGGAGRVVKVYDQFGHHDLTPAPGTVGPLLDLRNRTGGLPGLVFDNDGAFEGNPMARGQPYYAVSLRTRGLSIALRDGVTMKAGLRVGNITSVAASTLWSFAAGAANMFSVGVGNPSLRPGVPGDDRTSVLYGGLFPIGHALPSTSDILVVAATTGGIASRDAGGLTIGQHPLPPTTWHDITFGTTTRGGGAGWQLDSFMLFDRSLPTADIALLTTRLGATDPVKPRPTIVLDGSSVEAGMGSVGLRNFTRLYEETFPDARIYNVAVGGATTADRLAALPATLAVFPPLAGPRILVNGVGANSLGSGVSAADTYAQISQYVARAHAQLPGVKIGLTTIIPVAVAMMAGRGPAFDAYNVLVRANGAGADFIIDRAADPIMGNPSTVYPKPDLRFSTDGGHPAPEGYERLSAIDERAIAAVLK